MQEDIRTSNAVSLVGTNMGMRPLREETEESKYSHRNL